MEGSAPIRVVILYVHPLLGEGLAKLLAAEPGIEASAISTDDAQGTAAALTSPPDAIIIESHEDATSLTLPGVVRPPLLLFVDIAGAACTAPIARINGAPVTDDLERVVRAVRDLKRTRPALVSA